MFEALSDDELVARLRVETALERKVLCTFLQLLLEFARRDLQAQSPHATLFAYCVRELKLSESDAYRRVRSMEAARRFPLILEMLQSGELHLSAVAVLSAHLTPANHRKLLASAAGKSKRELEAFIATLPSFSGPAAARDKIVLLPQQPEAAKSAFLAGPGAGKERAAAAASGTQPEADSTQARSQAAPRAAARAGAQPQAAPAARISFTADRELLEELDRARELLAHRYPGGELGPLLKAALKALLEKVDLERQRAGRQARKARSASRRIPKWIRKVVRRRDGGRCAFSASDGRRCVERSWLEYDHIVPFALGGRSDDPDNVRLLCRAHNQQTARAIFGDRRPAASQPRPPN
jgi:hypothetical protein